VASLKKVASNRLAFGMVGLLAFLTFVRGLLLGQSALGSILIVMAFFAVVAGVGLLAFAVHRNLLGGDSPDR